MYIMVAYYSWVFRFLVVFFIVCGLWYCCALWILELIVCKVKQK